MYFKVEKSTYKTSGSLINGTILLSSAFGLITSINLIIAISALGNKVPLTFTIWAIFSVIQTIGTCLTFVPRVMKSPNVALYNLPLLSADLFYLVLMSNTSLLALDMATDDSTGDFIRITALILILLRYIGLSWSDNNFILKRIFCPVRVDTNLDLSAPML